MKLNKTFLFALITLMAVFAAYIFDYKSALNKEKLTKVLVLDFDIDQISYIQVARPDIKIGLQKSQTGWSLLEPIQDQGDTVIIEEMLKSMAGERQIAVVKDSETPLTDLELKEFGLDTPAAVFSLKNNAGNTKKIEVGSVKNFEGNSYLRVDSGNKIIIASGFWSTQAEFNLIYYREKKIYRGNPARVKHIKVRSLKDVFELERTGNQWFSVGNRYEIDQNKVRDILKKLNDTKIEEYVYEGEPSVKLIADKGLAHPPVRLELQTDDSVWAVQFNIQDKKLYALTERPTFLVRAEPSAWEDFGNLNLDGLRDRTTSLSFKTDEVKKIFYKNEGQEVDLVASGGKWKWNEEAPAKPPLNEAQIAKTINRIHDLRISEFIDDQNKRSLFEGKNMLILKSDTEKLVLQLNWGPSFKMKKAGEEKEYYYARTHLSDSIFALEKSLIDSLEFNKVVSSDSTKGGPIE